MNNLRDVKLNIKPIVFTFCHQYVYEGPCRSGDPEMLTLEYDLAKAEKTFAKESAKITAELGDIEWFNLLEPMHVNTDDNFLSLPSLVEEMAEGCDAVDVYLVSANSRNCELALMLGQRTQKPMVFVPSLFPMPNITTAAMNARGLAESWGHLSWDDVRKRLEALRARKVLRAMRILAVGRFGSERNGSALDNFVDYEAVVDRLGVNFVFSNIHEFLDQTHPLESEKNYTLPGRAALNPTAEEMEEIGRITDELIAHAERCEIERDDLLRSVTAWYVADKMLDAYECNAFMGVCPDACATRRLNEERLTFCLCHSLHHGLGIPSACEYDGPAAVSMALLGALGHKPTYMGNTTHQLFQGQGVPGTRWQDEEGNEVEEMPANTIATWHAVTTPYMHGFDEPATPYLLKPFTWSGFGATLRCDFQPDKGQEVTMCRIDPSCTKILVARGTVAGGVGYDASGCSIGVYLHIKDERDFFEKQCQCGNHVPLVYGDCYDEVIMLASMLGLEVLEA